VPIRKHEWLAVGAAAYIMTYAATTAVHATILCAIHASSTSLLPPGYVELGQNASFWIRGLVLDLDTDATLAIVCVGFLRLLPLAVYSTTFQKSEAKPILAVWAILMLIGSICCLITLYNIDTTPGGPFDQYRICAADDNSDISIPNTYLPLVLLLHKLFVNQEWRGQSTFRFMEARFIALQHRPMTVKVFLEFMFISFQAYSLLFAPVVMIIFVVFAEYSIGLDPESESIRHIGQWQPLVSVGLVVIAALLSKYNGKLKKFAIWR
jgi:hypothetical protein